MTNRYISPAKVDIKHPSGVAKFASNKGDCIDRNGNGRIETSSGPTDVLNWDDEEFTFRFNRRFNRHNSRSRGLVFRRLLEQTIATGPITEAEVTHGYDW